LAALPLKNPVMIGFGIKSKEDFESVTEKQTAESSELLL
jgi:tryptophan synthase alpha chain